MKEYIERFETELDEVAKYSKYHSVNYTKKKIVAIFGRSLEDATVHSIKTISEADEVLLKAKEESAYQSGRKDIVKTVVDILSRERDLLSDDNYIQGYFDCREQIKKDVSEILLIS